MKRFTFVVLIPWVLIGCGGGEESSDGAIDPPDRLRRPAPGIDEDPEPTERPDNLPYDGLNLPVPEDTPEAMCCQTDFALPDAEREADEISAVLMGDTAPLDVAGGIALTYSDGAWRVTECMPPNYAGTYYYVVSIADENGDIVFEDVRTNPNVETESEEAGTVNSWEAGETCEDIDVSLHGLDGE